VRCQYHPDAHLAEDYRAGDMICTECGLVVGDRVIDVGSEWRTFSNDSGSKDRSRVGDVENRFLSNSGSDLSTMIAAPTNGAETAFSNLSHHRRHMNAADRALSAAYREIGAMADRMNFPGSLVDRAKVNFKEAYESRQLKGRSNDAIAAACLYIACRQEGVPRTFKEICAVCTVPKKEIGRCFKLIIKTLEKSVNVITSEDFMKRFCNSLRLNRQVEAASIHIAKKSVELDLVGGRSPLSLAAAAIYMASQASETRKTAKEIGDVTGVAEVTIRQSYKQMHPRARDLFPENFKFAIPIGQLPMC